MKDECKIVITTDGKTTTARLFDGKRLIRSAESKCHPDDAFDFEVGAKLAVDRIFEKQPKPKNFLKTGVFGKSKNFGWFVVAGDKLVFEKGLFAKIDDYDDDLRICFAIETEEIEMLVMANCYQDARNKARKDVIWRR